MPAAPLTATTKPSVVLLHGIGGSAKGWPDQVTALTDAGCQPVPLDMVGFGARPPADSLDFETLAADVEGAIATRGLVQPVILGHSLGGMVVQTLLRRRPRGYRAAILSGTSAAFGNPTGDFQKKFVADRLAPLESGKTMPELATAIVDGMLGPQPDPAGRALAIALMGATSPRTYKAAVQALVTFDERANLGQIAVPVLCLAAEHDRNAPAPMMERLAGRIAGARYVCLPGLGHLANLEAPRAFNRPLLDFVGSLPTTAA